MGDNTVTLYLRKRPVEIFIVQINVHVCMIASVGNECAVNLLSTDIMSNTNASTCLSKVPIFVHFCKPGVCVTEVYVAFILDLNQNIV